MSSRAAPVRLIHAAVVIMVVVFVALQSRPVSQTARSTESGLTISIRFMMPKSASHLPSPHPSDGER